jgi:hypothetical protein
LRLPTLATIAFARRVQFVASATPIDCDHTWLWARYGQDYIPGWQGSRVIARLAAKFDIELVFTHRDMRMLASQQRNRPEFPSYHLFEADRAIALGRRLTPEFSSRGIAVRRADRRIWRCSNPSVKRQTTTMAHSDCFRLMAVAFPAGFLFLLTWSDLLQQNEYSHRIHSASFIDIRWTESPMPTASETLALLTTQEGAEALAVEPGTYYVACEQNRENI